MQVLVSGATGFIGTHLVRRLSKVGYRVTCLVRPTSDRSALQGLADVSFAEGDLRDPASLASPVRAVDVVFHLEARLRTPWRSDYHQVNVQGSKHLAAACARQATPPVFVLVSSLPLQARCLRDELAARKRIPRCLFLFMGGSSWRQRNSSRNMQHECQYRSCGLPWFLVQGIGVCSPYSEWPPAESSFSLLATPSASHSFRWNT